MRWSAAQALSWIICGEAKEIGQWMTEMGPKIKAAQEALAKAIGSEQVHAWGRPRPHEELGPVAAGQFRITNLPVVVNPYGEMVSRQVFSSYNGPKWGAIEFNADQVKRAWPRPPCEAAIYWMVKEAERLKMQGGIGKRDDMVQRCMNGTHCTRDEARTAYGALPDDMKYRRGRPSGASA